MASLTLKTRRFFDGTALQSGRTATISIADERISGIQFDDAAALLQDAPEARVIDATELTILPGLIDAHFHPVSSSFDIASIDR